MQIGQSNYRGKPIGLNRSRLTGNPRRGDDRPVKASTKVAAMAPDDANGLIVHFRSDGLALSPASYARLLAQIADRSGIAEDDYSRDGVVGELEARMAALLGKETA